MVRGLWKHANGFWYFSRMRLGVRRTVALETRDETAAIQRALDIVDSPALALAGSLEGEIEAFIKFKVDQNCHCLTCADINPFPNLVQTPCVTSAK